VFAEKWKGKRKKDSVVQRSAFGFWFLVYGSVSGSFMLLIWVIVDKVLSLSKRTYPQITQITQIERHR
jgi:hypothetical protein